MGYELGNQVTTTVKAGVDLSAAQGKFIIKDQVTGLARLPAVLGEVSLGVLLNTPSVAANGNGVRQFEPVIAVNGVTKIVVDAAYQSGTAIMALYSATAADNGMGTQFIGETNLVVPLTNYDVGDGTHTWLSARGRLLEASTAKGDVVAMLLING